MKIVVLVGSFRKQGNTSQVAALICDHLRREAEAQQVALELETIYLGHRQIEPCRGCRACFHLGEARCPIRDDMAAIKSAMLAADGMLIASPVYVDDVNGITKNWIDRLAYACHRPAFAGKVAYLVATVASSPTRHALQTLATAVSTWGFHIAGQAGFKMGALMKPEETAAAFDRQAQAAARRFLQAIHHKAYARPTFRALLTFKIQQMFWQRLARQGEGLDENLRVDLAYWQGRGWLEARSAFYIPHQASRGKVALARLAGAALAPFVT